jgi:tetratricopeptide (TPR) repeat protein
LIAAARVEAGNEILNTGDLDGAVTLYRAAAAEVPVPVVQGFWDEGLLKIPAILYFRDRRDAAIEIAGLLETKAGTNSIQLLGLANFFLTIEDGTSARRIAEKTIATEPTSAAYRTLGLAERMDFKLEESAVAFQKALELEPDSTASRNGLAEMKRSLGKADEAVTLYRAILEKTPDDKGARTGLVLSLFDDNKRAEAEAEMARALEASSGNVILLGGAAYWYAAHNEADKAVELSRKAIEQNPRFIWSYIALARGLLLQGNAAEAERTLLSARRWGNFPTLQYELAAMRFANGYYREAAEDLSTSFTVKDGEISTLLGGRVTHSSKLFTELVGFERLASIFVPTAADDPEKAAKLAALLALKLELDAAEPNADAVATATDEFVKGSDAMQMYRQLYAASALLEKKIALPKVVELTKAAVPNVDAALGVPNSSIAVMASELYEERRIAGTRSQYVSVPTIQRMTLSAIVRGRIEDISGWTQYQMGAGDEAVIHLRRAVGVLPVDSAWWRSSMWRLGSALAVTGKDAEALDTYVKAYKSAAPDGIHYAVIESLYRRLNGSADGLVEKVGENPMQAVAANGPQPTPDVTAATSAATPSPPPSVTPTPTPVANVTPYPEATATPLPDVTPTPGPTAIPTPTPEPSPAKTPETGTQAATKDLFPPVIITIPSATSAKADAVPTPTPTPEVGDPRPVSSPSPSEQATSAAEVSPCTLTASENTITLRTGGGDLAVIVGREDDAELEGLEATSSSPADVKVYREAIAGVRSRALFVLRSTSDKTGIYQVAFSLPCGKKTVIVNVR